MKNTLITIDWDYFMPYISKFNVSCLENKRNIQNNWYKLYLENKMNGIDITKTMKTGQALEGFWEKINNVFNIAKKCNLIVSDSHKIAYRVAKEIQCDKVYNFDSHTDLGYGGLESLDFEVNCANWLGRLLKDNIIKCANIILSPYTGENRSEFKELNMKYLVKYNTIDEIAEDSIIDTIHICRSGAWTPPWLDNEFFSFINYNGMEIKYIEFEKRNWDIKNITLADKIEYMIFN